jgi:hypothetical protein
MYGLPAASRTNKDCDPPRMRRSIDRIGTTLVDIVLREVRYAGKLNSKSVLTPASKAGNSLYMLMARAPRVFTPLQDFFAGPISH